MHTEEPREWPGAEVIREEEHVLAVGRPANGDMGGWIPGKAARHTSIGADYVNFSEAVFSGRIGDLRAVGRIEGAIGYRVDGGQTASFAAVARDCPDVVRVEKSNPVLAERRVAQQQRCGTLSGTQV